MSLKAIKFFDKVCRRTCERVEKWSEDDETFSPRDCLLSDGIRLSEQWNHVGGELEITFFNVNVGDQTR